jgi:hypothetical protein
MVKKIVVLNTKGGCGKSTISHFILPFYFAKGKEGSDGNWAIKEEGSITLFELEATNKNRKSQYSESMIKYVYDCLDDADKTEDILSEVSFDEESFVIFDVGGGRDAIKAIQSFREASGSLDEFLFVLPFTLSYDSFDGAVNMHRRLKEEDEDIKVVFAINRMTFRYDDGGKPYKEFLEEKDIQLGLKKAGIDMTEILKEENVRLSYIPEMPELLPNVLYSLDGCCLDICLAYLKGKSGSEQRKELKERLKSSKSPNDNNKELYVEGMKDITRRGELFKMLHYCKPFFETIDSLGGKRFKSEKTEKTEKEDMTE